MNDLEKISRLKTKNNYVLLIIIIFAGVNVFSPYILKCTDFRTSEILRTNNNNNYDLADSITISAGDYETFEIKTTNSAQDISIYIETAISNQFIDFFFFDVTNYDKWQQDIGNFNSIVKYHQIHCKRMNFTVQGIANYFLILSNRDGTTEITTDFLVDFDMNTIPYFEDNENKLVGNGIVLEIGDFHAIVNDYTAGDKIILEMECYFPFDELLLLTTDVSNYEDWLSLNKPYSNEDEYYGNIITSEYIIENDGEMYLIFYTGRHLDTVIFSYSLTIIENQPSLPPPPSSPSPPLPTYLVIIITLVLITLVITIYFVNSNKKKYKY